MFSRQQNGKTRGQNRGWAVRDVAQTVYTHVSKCKNDKMKEREEKKKSFGKKNY
jgi:hypothetical protein